MSQMHRGFILYLYDNNRQQLKASWAEQCDLQLLSRALKVPQLGLDAGLKKDVPLLAKFTPDTLDAMLGVRLEMEIINRPFLFFNLCKF